jgi:chemotaxis methyl-accepting protein methylase
VKDTNAQIASVLKESYGLDVSGYDRFFLEKSVANRISESNSASAVEYCKLLKENSIEGMAFIDSLRINYTTFFRNPLTFAVLGQVILPSLILNKSRRRDFRIWSAACSTGQEAYSLAIILEELKKESRADLRYIIFATDHCESLVDRAAAGKYPYMTICNLSLKQVKQWFIKHGDHYTVKPELKGNIDFSVVDLLDMQLSSPPASIYGDFDLIFCSNILYYYSPEFRKIILQKITGCLADGGLIITSEAERGILLQSGYYEVYPYSGIFRV